MKHSDKMLVFFDKILNEKKCYELARQHKFVQRSSSKLKGFEFIKTMIIPSEGLSTDSLKGLSLRMRELNPDADLSAQALCERINNSAAKDLIKAVFGEILFHMRSSVINKSRNLAALHEFQSIYVQDSTVITLNEKLQESFQGTNRGGTGAKAQVKIDLIYDLMSERIIDAELHHGKVPDQGLAGRILKFIKPGDLIIRDQGYFVLKVFLKILELGAFVISRLLPHVKIYLKRDDTTPVDLGRHLRKNYSSCPIVDIPIVFIGDEKVPMRLVLYKLPKDVMEVKLREANKRAKATGRQMSQGKKTLLHYAAFVTNVPEEVISAEVLGTLYRLRWEIELIFKRWKSQLTIDYLKGIDKNRIECLIWSRLCTILYIEIFSGYVYRIAQAMRLSEVEISHAKIISYLLRLNKLWKAIVHNKLDLFLQEIEKDVLRFLLKDKRERRTMREKVNEFEPYYYKQHTDNQHVA